jgi:hypothetical protein
MLRKLLISKMTVEPARQEPFERRTATEKRLQRRWQPGPPGLEELKK